MSPERRSCVLNWNFSCPFSDLTYDSNESAANYSHHRASSLRCFIRYLFRKIKSKGTVPRLLDHDLDVRLGITLLTNRSSGGEVMLPASPCFIPLPCDVPASRPLPHRNPWAEREVSLHPYHIFRRGEHKTQHQSHAIVMYETSGIRADDPARDRNRNQRRSSAGCNGAEKAWRSPQAHPTQAAVDRDPGTNFRLEESGRSQEVAVVPALRPGPRGAEP